MSFAYDYDLSGVSHTFGTMKEPFRRGTSELANEILDGIEYIVVVFLLLILHARRARLLSVERGSSQGLHQHFFALRATPDL